MDWGCAYLQVMKWRSEAYRKEWPMFHATQVPDCKVVSIGNLTTGGTGKTPVTLCLARRWASRAAVGIASRGYGRTSRGLRDVVINVNDPERVFGDEPCMYVRELALPVAVASARVRAVQRLKERGANLILADDAFQHLALRRDVDLVLLDATTPEPYWRGLPFGRMREPWSALSRASFVLITKIDQAGEDRVRRLRQEAAQWISAERIQLWRQELVLPQVVDEVVLVSGIARPDLFEEMMRAKGLQIRRHFRFADHHNYSSAELDQIRSFAQSSRVRQVITTSKDYYKLLPKLGDLEVLTAQVHALPQAPTSLQDLDRYVFGT